MKNLPRFRRRHLRRNLVTVDDVVKLIDRSFEWGYQAGRTGKYRKPAKRSTLLAMVDDLRAGRPL